MSDKPKEHNMFESLKYLVYRTDKSDSFHAYALDEILCLKAENKELMEKVKFLEDYEEIIKEKMHKVHLVLEKVKAHGIDHDSDCEVVANIDKTPECDCGAWSVEDSVKEVLEDFKDG